MEMVVVRKQHILQKQTLLKFKFQRSDNERFMTEIFGSDDVNIFIVPFSIVTFCQLWMFLTVFQ